ncbi:MAG: phosphoenolpyruvate carboxykinase, partial [Gammaproteobacteria bacterium]|nr:phosphoenolpyruvate carboxykinase [Gammaproteobacteria bacterium]
MATAADRLRPLPQLSPAVSSWVDSVRELTQPRAVYWCEGTEAEMREITAQLLEQAQLTKLNPAHFPACYLYRSAPNDVARVEHLTYICTRSREDAGPNNHWMDPQQAHTRMRELFRGCMRERTL